MGRGRRADAHAALDLTCRVALDHERGHAARGVLEADPLLHDLHRPVHPPAEDRAELVDKPLDHERGYVENAVEQLGEHLPFRHED